MASRASDASRTLSQRVFDGDLYNISYKNPAMVDQDSVYIGLSTGTDLATFYGISISSNSSLLDVSFCENSVFSSGTPVLPVSHNRNEKTEIFLESFSLNPTVSDEGVPIYDLYVVGTTEMGTNKTATNESLSVPWLLESSNNYLIKITNLSGSTNAISVSLIFSR